MVRCGIVGGSGYTGAELVARLSGHPEARLEQVQADSSAGQAFAALHPRLRHHYTGRLSALDADGLAGLDVVFCALPHGVSGRVVAELFGKVGTIIDLSGDFRGLDAAAYERWYGHPHPAPSLLGKAVYGLPELFGAELRGARLIACAGCYATAVQLAAAPAARLGKGRLAVTASALSGTSGAGRKGDLPLSFSEVGGNARAYRVGMHQHAPEMAMGIARHAGRPVDLTFVPHLIPVVRGILASVVMPLPDGWGGLDFGGVYRQAYEGKPFVRVAGSDRLPEIADVVGTNFCDIAPVVDREGKTLVVIAVLDNLIKGAAGQAIQAMNLALGLPETAGFPEAGAMVATRSGT